MARFFISVFALVFSFQAFASSGTSSVIKGYSEWKADKMQAASTQIAHLKSQLQKETNRKNHDNLEKQIAQLKWNLEVASDLSVADYFILYLSQQSQTDRYHQASLKLSHKEIAELMEAYANTLSTAPSEVVVRPSAQNRIPSKLPSTATTQSKDQVK